MDHPPISFALRPATVHDVPALAGVHLASWLATYRGIMADAYLDSLTCETFESYHRPRFTDGVPDPHQPFVVACDRSSGRLIGFARGGPARATSPTGDPLPPGLIDRFSAELYAIYLLPEHHGRGVGSAMLREIVARLVALGHANLCVWVLVENHVGRRFYERMGAGAIPGAESPVTLGGVAYPHMAYGWKNLSELSPSPQ